MASWPPLLLLIGFGWELQMSHTMPHGPIAFSLLIAAAIWIWSQQGKLQEGTPGSMAKAG